MLRQVFFCIIDLEIKERAVRNDLDYTTTTSLFASSLGELAEDISAKAKRGYEPFTEVIRVPGSFYEWQILVAKKTEHCFELNN